MALKDVILDRIAEGVEDDPVHGIGDRESPHQLRRRHLVGLDEPEIQFHRGIDLGIGDEHRKGLAVLGPRHPHGAELLGQAD